MKALLCKEFGPPETLSYEEIDDPELKDGHILVDIYSASVNFPDVLMIEDKYQFKPPLPFTPGGELSGVVSAVGEGVTEFNVGDEVIGMPGNGGFAEQILISKNQLFKKPSNFSRPLANIKQGRVLVVKKCDDNWCKVQTENLKGWVDNKNLWGKVN